MSNFFLSYDLNGSIPTHAQMDKFLENLTRRRARILETVWWVDYTGTALQLCNQIKQTLSQNDQLVVIEAKDAAWTTNLLVDSDALIGAWQNAA